MKFRLMSAAAVVALSLGAASLTSWSPVLAQGDAPKKEATKKETSKDGDKVEGRVPAYYAQIGLSKDQRNKVLETQASYATKIEALRKQIADLESKRDADVRGVLTDDQRKKLDEMVDAAKKKAAESRSKAKAETSKESAAKPAAESK